MSRTRRTAANFVASALSIAITSTLVLFITRTVLKYLGSDYNGLNATVTQMLTLLSLVEGSFTLASLVALYKPHEESDHEMMDRILSTTGRAFTWIGTGVLGLGIAFSFGYAAIVKTGLDYGTVVAVMAISVATAAFNTLFVNVYRLVFQVTQTEYIPSFIVSGSNVLAYACAYLVIVETRSILLLRLVYAAFNLLSGVVVILVARRRHRFVRLAHKPEYHLVKGTKDVFIGTATGLVYSSSAVMFISTFVGTVVTSVYAVYNSVTSLVGNMAYAFLNAPKNALGQVVAHGDEERTHAVFREYELLTLLSIGVLYSTTYALMLPFVRLYTAGIVDVEYIRPALAILLVVNAVLQYVHIPSGMLINLSGRFRAARNIQLAACGTLIVLTVGGAVWFSLYGILAANAITSLLLVVLEVGYARRRILKRSVRPFLLRALPNLALSSLLGIVGSLLAASLATTVLSFVLFGAVALATNAAASCILNLLLFPSETKALLRRARSLIPGLRRQGGERSGEP